MATIQFKDVSRVFKRDGKDFLILDNIQLMVQDQEFVAIVGPSGCGKTTCMRMAAGLEFPSTGTVQVNDVVVTEPGPDRAVVFQQFALFPWKTVHDNIDYIEVASIIASRSAGPATRANLDEYIETTELALKKFSGAQKTKAILILNPARPPIDMQTTIYAKIKNPNIEAIRHSVDEMMTRITQYVPGYQLIVQPTLDSGKVVTTVKVLGNGDYLPRYAGNLDIINCAAIGIAERIASQQKEGKS